GDDLRRVAFDERLRIDVAARLRIRGPRAEKLRVLDLDRARAGRLAYSGQVRIREIDTLETDSQASHVARIVDAQRPLRHDGRHLEQIGLHTARYAHTLRAVGRFTNRHQAGRTFLLHDIAGVGHPGRRLKTLK